MCTTVIVISNTTIAELINPYSKSKFSDNDVKRPTHFWGIAKWISSLVTMLDRINSFVDIRYCLGALPNNSLNTTCRKA